MSGIFDQVVNYAVATGTVTNVGVTTANGVSATVSDPTGSPSLTFTLGAITPSSVNVNTIYIRHRNY